jgi:hypothetical protein
MKTVRLYNTLMLDWPASTTWYHFLQVLHERIAQSERMHYDDKDIMLVMGIQFRNGENGYQRPDELMVCFTRFNERGNINPDHSHLVIEPKMVVGKVQNLSYRIKLKMVGTTVESFDYERME